MERLSISPALCPPQRRAVIGARLRHLTITLLWTALVATIALVAIPAPDAKADSIVLLDEDAQWHYWRNTTAPGADWMSADFDDSAWPQGQAPLGAGARLSDEWLGTRLSEGRSPLTTYFRTTFAWSQVDGDVTFTTWADDGAVIFVNGVEIARQRLASTTLTHDAIYADSAVSTTAAISAPWVVTIPSSVLHDGENVVAAMVVANYRAAKDVSFGGVMTAQPAVRVPDGAAIIGEGAIWQYWRANQEPNVAWSYSAEDLGWSSGPSPLGYGATGLATTLDPLNPRPRSTYFRHTFSIDNLDKLPDGAQFTTIADDGVLVYVNGHEIGRYRINNSGAAPLSISYASAAASTTTARANPVTFNVPAQYLREGANVISVQVIANYGSTPDISFQGTLTAGGGGPAPEVGTPDPNLQLVWSDEFDGTSVNTNNWNVYNYSTYGDGGKQTECLMNRPENIGVADGYLTITARREETPITCGTQDARFPNGRDYTSAHIYSSGKFSFMYGRLEMRAQMPMGQGTSQGLWPAFWLRPVDGGLGEIDIIEALGSRPGGDWGAGIVYQTLHRDYVGTPSSGFNYQMPQGGSMDDGFHTYAIEWTPTEIRWFVDDVLTRTVTSDDLAWYDESFVGREFIIRINMAVGGSWPGNATSDTQFPAEYIVDYVRLYQ